MSNSQFNNLLEQLDKLSLQEHNRILNISRKRYIEKKRKKLLKVSKLAEKDYKSGNTRTVSVDELMNIAKNSND